MESELIRRSKMLIIGDLDKPFHRPECECDRCEQWRTHMGRPTNQEVRSVLTVLKQS